jgi:hypothetical protein
MSYEEQGRAVALAIIAVSLIGAGWAFFGLAIGIPPVGVCAMVLLMAAPGVFGVLLFRHLGTLKRVSAVIHNHQER